MPSCRYCGDNILSNARNRYGVRTTCSKIECHRANYRAVNKRKAERRKVGIKPKPYNKTPAELPEDSWYWNVVTKNAIRDGKKPADVARDIKRKRSSGTLNPMDTADINKKLTAYLKRRGQISTFNGRTYEP